jgi:RHH-type proline utilization regulon transcriptional repressor/proline dehydrogenase/delta 1-pyrroline-5-carboxylate dehydrogenase
MDFIREISERSLITAENWMKEAISRRSPTEEGFGKMVASMLTNKNDKLILVELLDRCFRADTASRSVEQVKYIFDKYGMAHFFSGSQSFMLWLFLTFGGLASGLSMKFFEDYLRNEVKGVVLKGEASSLNPHIKQREDEGFRLNLNLIGEAVLGEEEAKFRKQEYIKILQGDVKYISIKASTIYSQINSLDYAKTVAELKIHLADIFRAARDNTFVNELGENERKFINLDMEEYRDMEIVYEAFMQLLDEEEFLRFSAGIVIQAYIPDSFGCMEKIIAWSKKRIAAGGVPVKIRLVKGANMEMEYIESSSKHWPMVTFERKTHSDANYKRCLIELMKPENAQAVNIGVASHNIFDISFAYELAKEHGTLRYVQFETLEGMVESTRQTIKSMGQKIVVYGPAAVKENFTNAIAYLVRRLDENTGDENFLRYSFGMEIGTPEWELMRGIFLESIDDMPNIKNTPKRTQDRGIEPPYEKTDFSKFINEADTDFVLPQNRRWAEQIAEKWRNISDIEMEIGSVIGGNEYKDSENIVAVYDKSVWPKENIVGRCHLADEELLAEAVNVAVKGFEEWSAVSFEEKLNIFDKARHLYKKRRGDLIGIAAAEVGKVFTETDVEVSEAIDFIYFYTHAMKSFMDKYPHLAFTGKGICTVISPWNFPVAIPTGGIMTSLISGNATIFKPASLSTLTGRMLCDLLWEAGVPKNALQFISAKGSLVEKAILKDSRVDACVFTGSESTAWKILEARPDLLISAETGGKDGTIVTALADRDQAIKNVLHSAFSNSGQKCSATSLLVLEEEVFNDKKFKETLKDAAMSMKTGSVWNFGNRLGALASLPSGALEKAAADKQGEWLVPPTYAEDNPYMMRPAIKWGVERGSFFHMTELFGPILSVMKAKNLKDAIDIVNQTGYGLTSGLESLDEREWAYWRENLKAGNLYINRSTTGAIVLRQPFGGLRNSAVGLGRKAGTYNYVAQFTNIKEKEAAASNGAEDVLAEKLAEVTGESAELYKKISANYSANVRDIFGLEVDYMKIRGEDNIFRYLKVPEVVIRYYKENSPKDLACAIMALRSLGIPFTVSADDAVSADCEGDCIVTKLSAIGINAITEREHNFYGRFSPNVRVRYLDKASIKREAYAAMYQQAGYFAYAPVLAEGRFELLNYLHEQSISTSFHRYGNLGNRKTYI